MKSIPLVGGPVSFEGAVDLEVTNLGVQPWRLPLRRREIYPLDLRYACSRSSGVRVTSLTDSRNIILSAIQLDIETQNLVDLVIDGKLIGSTRLTPGEEVELVFENLPPGLKRVELYLPNAQVRVTGLQIDDNASAEGFADNRMRMVTYGSSIMEATAAHSPSRTWCASVARRHDLHLTNLAYSGQCLAEQLVARMIARLPADRLCFYLGGNLHQGSHVSQRVLENLIIGFILTVRDQHPTTPLLIVSPIFMSAFEIIPNHQGYNVDTVRQILEQSVNKLRTAGDENLHYLNGLQLLAGPDANRLSDQLHPDAIGYDLMAERFDQKAFAAGGPLAV